MAAVLALVVAWMILPAADAGGGVAVQLPAPVPTAVAPSAPPTDDAARHPVAARPEIDARIGLVGVAVRDEDGAPLAGCEVVFGDEDPVTTDASGNAEFAVIPGRFLLEVQPAAGSERRPVRQRVTATGGQRTEVEALLPLLQVPEFWCRVVDAGTGAPITGATVAVQPYGDELPPTDADGYVTVPPGSADNSFVRIAAAGHAACRVVPRGGHTARERAFEVRLPAEAVLQLRVVDPDRRPVRSGSATVTAMAWAMMAPRGTPPRGGAELWVGDFDDDGQCAIAGLPAGAPVFVTVVPPYELATPGSVTWTLQPGANARELQLEALGEMRGRVVDPTGRPVAGARIKAIRAGAAEEMTALPERADGESVLTAEDGAFHLGPMQPGSWICGVADTDGWTSTTRHVDVPGGGTANVQLRAEPALSISGRLLGPGNKPIGQFEVQAMRGDTVVAVGVTENDGSFTIGSLAPGDYDVRTELYDQRLAMPAPQRVAAGTSGVAIRVVPVLGDLRGHAVLPGGAGGEVFWRALRRGGDEFTGGRCDLDGRFAKERLRTGTWDVIVADGRGRVGAVHGVAIEADAQTADLEVLLARGAVLRPVHPAADAFDVVAGDAAVAREALQFGLPGEVVVPPGTWTVVFRRGIVELGRREVTVAAGDEALVEG